MLPLRYKQWAVVGQEIQSISYLLGCICHCCTKFRLDWEVFCYSMAAIHWYWDQLYQPSAHQSDQPSSTCRILIVHVSTEHWVIKVHLKAIWSSSHSQLLKATGSSEPWSGPFRSACWTTLKVGRLHKGWDFIFCTLTDFTGFLVKLLLDCVYWVILWCYERHLKKCLIYLSQSCWMVQLPLMPSWEKCFILFFHFC